MAAQPQLIERIYEAAALPERWPDVLDGVAREAGARGVCFVHRTGDAIAAVLSSGMVAMGEAYLAEGWAPRDGRAAPVIAEQYPGFRIDADYWTEDQVRTMPIYRDFLLPRGLNASASCFLQGVRDDALHVAVEGLPSYNAARTAVPYLDAVRPHLARAFSLSARLREAKAANAVLALNLAGVGAAVVSFDGRLRAVNDRFASRLGNMMSDQLRKLRFADRFLQAQLSRGLAACGTDAGVRSVAVGARDNAPGFAIHLIPLTRGARDVFGWDGVLLLLAEPANACVPGADLLRLLFDLTPAEARLTRLLVEGRSQTDAAHVLGITGNTARTHLRRIFAKTGVTRQAELVRLLAGLGAPD